MQHLSIRIGAMASGLEWLGPVGGLYRHLTVMGWVEDGDEDLEVLIRIIHGVRGDRFPPARGLLEHALGSGQGTAR